MTHLHLSALTADDENGIAEIAEQQDPAFAEDHLYDGDGLDPWERRPLSDASLSSPPYSPPNEVTAKSTPSFTHCVPSMHSGVVSHFIAAAMCVVQMFCRTELSMMDK